MHFYTTGSECKCTELSSVLVMLMTNIIKPLYQRKKFIKSHLHIYPGKQIQHCHGSKKEWNVRIFSGTMKFENSAL